MNNKILLQQLTDALAARAGITKRKADAFVRAFFDVAEEGLTTEAFLKIKGFATFKIITVSERESVNINTGERFQINGHEKISFTPDTAFKELVNRPFSHFTTINLEDDLDLSEWEGMSNFAEEESERAENPSADAAEIDETTETLTEEAAETLTNGSAEPSAVTENPIEIAESLENEEPPTLVEMADSEIVSEADEQSEAAEIAELGAALAEAVSAEPTIVSEVSHPEEKADDGKEEGKEESVETVEESVGTAEESVGTAEESIGTAEESVEAAEESVETAEESTETAEGSEVAETEEEPLLQAQGNAVPQHESEEKPAIVINNTLPEQKHNGWRTACVVIGVLLLMAMSYFVGYYRLLCPCYTDFLFTATPSEETAAPARQQTAAETPKAKAESSTTQTSAPQTTAKDSTTKAENTQQKTETPQPKATDSQTAAQNRRKAELAAAKKYRQTSGPYLITGVVRTHVMAPGDNLYLLAKKEYGNKDMASYIIFHNQLSNPDLIQLGQKIEIPRLTPKEE